MTCGGFRFLEHISDAYVEASGQTLEEAFEYAAKGMFEIITNTQQVEPKEERTIKDSAMDLENALYRWLEDLLILHDSEGLVFKVFRVKLKEAREGLIDIAGKAWGEKFNPSKHEIRTEVKAVTYSLMEIKKLNECWIVRYVVDL